jgi:hypothetical protein
MGHSHNHNKKRTVAKSQPSNQPTKNATSFPSAHIHGSDVGSASSFFPYARSPFRQKDALLVAAQDGWSTTIRYAFLLCVQRAPIGAAIWLAIEFARHIGWF